MKNILLFLFLFLFSLTSVGQFIIEGHVFDEDTLEPLPFTEIRIPNGLENATTNFDGYFKFNSSSANDTVIFSYLGYNAQKKTIEELLSLNKIQIQLKSASLKDPSIISYRMEFIEGNIYDAKTNEPIPYVNIGIPKLAIGTVSDDQGFYKIKLTNNKDTIIISSIGYHQQKLTVRELLQNKYIYLEQQIHKIKEIEILSKRLGKEILLGKKNKNRGLSIGFANRQLGCEIGSVIKIKKETFLKSAYFKINHADGDSLLFRVNIYHFEKKNIGENILKENVIIYAPQKRGILTVDLTPFELIINQDVLLTLEWIKDDNGKGNNGITFDTKKGRKSNIYEKRTSQAPFKINKAFGRMGLKKKSLCFWFIGKEILNSK